MYNFLGKDLGEKPKKFNDQLLIKLIICQLNKNRYFPIGKLQLTFVLFKQCQLYMTLFYFN